MKKGEQLSKMLLLATQAHDGQFDKGGNPYILHPLKVMYKLKSEDEELMCIALGHDVVEDGKINGERVTFQMLRDLGFSDRIVSGIACLTKQTGQTYEEYKTLIKSNYDSLRVKKSDLRHNSDLRRLKGVTQKDLDRVAKYMLFYAELEQYEKEHYAMV